MNYNTKQRQILLDTFKNNKNKSFNAKDLLLLLSNDLSKATLYRELDSLEKENIINKYFNQVNNSFEYQYNNIEEHCNSHLHMKCLTCGRVIHLHGLLNKEITNNEISFKVDFTHSLIMGTCKECLNK